MNAAGEEPADIAAFGSDADAPLSRSAVSLACLLIKSKAPTPLPQYCSARDPITYKHTVSFFCSIFLRLEFRDPCAKSRNCCNTLFQHVSASSTPKSKAAAHWCGRDGWQQVWVSGTESVALKRNLDPLMPALFALGVAPALRAMQTDLLPSESVRAFLDDT